MGHFYLKMNKWLIVLLIFLFSILLRLWNLNQIGRTWDEAEYVEPGYKYIKLLSKGDFDNSYFYTTYNHPPLIKYLYGIAAHLDIEKIDSNGEPVFKYDLTYSRAVSLIVFSIGVIFVILIGWEFISPFCGVVAGIILSLLPFSLGLSQLVTAESMKIFIYTVVIYIYMRLLEKYSLKKLILSGILTGIALQIKQTNILLILLLGFMYYFRYKSLKGEEKDSFIKKSLLYLFTVSVISIFVFFLVWPQAIFHFNDLYTINKKLWSVEFSSKIWQITLSPPEVFFGRLMLTPIFYYAVYFFITIPVVILGFFFMGIFSLCKKKNWKLYFLMVWFFLPFILSVYSWRQHGLRYIIEIYPSISLIAALGFTVLLNKLKIKNHSRIFFFLPVAIYMFILLLQIKPYYLDYFNELIGGTGTVYKHRLFQIGWWGQGVGEAGKYLSKIISSNSKIGIAVSPVHVVPPLNQQVYIYRDTEEYDYIVVNYYNILREGFDDRKIRVRYKPIYFVYADGAVLATVYKHK